MRWCVCSEGREDANDPHMPCPASWEVVEADSDWEAVNAVVHYLIVWAYRVADDCPLEEGGPGDAPAAYEEEDHD